MRKFLVLALVPMFFAATACNKSEETPAPDAGASAAASALRICGSSDRSMSCSVSALACSSYVRGTAAALQR